MAGKSYQNKPDDIREVVFQRGCFSALELFRVAAWKSARGLASLTLNSEDEIHHRSASALQAIEPWRQIDVLIGTVDWVAWRATVVSAVGSKPDKTGLLGLHGFGYPMASAFLAFLAPTAFPVIDRWTVKAVYGADFVAKVGQWHKSAAYTHFAQQLVNRRRDFPAAETIHQLDQTVMNLSMLCDHESRPCSCFPSWPVALPRS